jgi:hypothetical protein
MFHLEKKNPVENSDYRPRFHSLNLKNEDGEIVAWSHLHYRNDVVPSYYVELVEVSYPLQNKGLGQRLVDELNTFLEDKKSVGILRSLEPTGKGEHIYTKKGWESFRDTDFMFFNVPSYIGESDKLKIIKAIKDSHSRSKD